jgi:hypothetical protein
VLVKCWDANVFERNLLRNTIMQLLKEGCCCNSMCLPDELWGTILAKLVLPCSGYNEDSASLRLTCKAMQRLVNQSVTTIALQWIDDGVEAARYPRARRLVNDRGGGLQNIAERLASWSTLQDLLLPPDYHILQAAVSSCKGMQRLVLDMRQQCVEPESLLQCFAELQLLEHVGHDGLLVWAVRGCCDQQPEQLACAGAQYRWS